MIHDLFICLLFVCLYIIINLHLRIHSYTLSGSIAVWRLFDSRMHLGQWLVAGLQTRWNTELHLGHFQILSTWNGNNTGSSLQI